MPNILIRDVSERTIKQLKTRAKQHNRSLQGEVKSLIEENVKTTAQGAFLRARKIRSSFGKRKFTDSVELLREDRNR